MTTIDLNCDLGEGFGAWEMGNDAAMIDLATSVNVACGFHAGDADIMRHTVELAKARGVSEESYMSGNLLGREVYASEVAEAFVYLAHAEKTTAAVITVDGGNIEAALR